MAEIKKFEASTTTKADNKNTTPNSSTQARAATPPVTTTQPDNSTTEENQNASGKKKNFKNLTISLQQQQQQQQKQQQQFYPPSSTNNMKCECAHYFNTENIADTHSSTTDNVPSTVKSISPDSLCTYGTHYPNRIFVGHLPGKASATDLADFFRNYGTVLEGKVVLDTFGRSRRFGFVTFATQDDVQNVLSQIPIFFKGKKINVGPAVKKMFAAEFSPPASPAAESSSSSQHSDDESTNPKTIITVPPVNEGKDPSTPSTPKSGNVWLKINSKPKLTPKKPNDKPHIYSQQFVYPTITSTATTTLPTYQQQQLPQAQLQQQQSQPQYQRHPQQQQQYQPRYYYPPYYPTAPCNQTYSYQNGYYAQSPVYYGEAGQAYIINQPNWNMQPSVYLTGSLVH